MIQNYKTKSEKIQALRVIGDDAIQKINQDKQSWRKFLDFNAKFYKYAFSEALLIYAQDPNATMCGEVKHWNKIGRNVHKGTKGTAIFDEMDLKSDLRYIFDVSNTYGKEDKLNRNIALTEPYYDSVLQQLKKQTATDFPTDNFAKNFKWAVEEYVRNNSLEYLEGIQYDLTNSKFENMDIEEMSNQFINTVVDSVGYMVCEKLDVEKGLYANDDLAFEHLENFNTKQMISRLGIATNHLSKNVLQIVNQAITAQRAMEKERGRTNDNRNEQQQSQRNSTNDIGASERNNINDGRGNNRGTIQPTERQEPTARQIRENGVELSEGRNANEVQQPSVGGLDVPDLPTGGQGRTGIDGGTSKRNESENATPERRLYGNIEIRNEDKGRGGSDSSARDSLQTEITENETTHEESPNGGSFLTQEDEMLIKAALTNESLYPAELHESIYKIFCNDDFSLENKADTLFALYQHCNIDSVIKLDDDNFIFDFDDEKISLTSYEVAEIIEELIDEGNYPFEEENEEFDDYAIPDEVSEMGITDAERFEEEIFEEEIKLKVGDHIKLENRDFNVQSLSYEDNSIRLVDLDFIRKGLVPITRVDQLDYVLNRFEFVNSEEVQEEQTPLQSDNESIFQPTNRHFEQPTLFDLPPQKPILSPQEKEDFNLWAEDSNNTKKVNSTGENEKQNQTTMTDEKIQSPNITITPTNSENSQNQTPRETQATSDITTEETAENVLKSNFHFAQSNEITAGGAKTRYRNNVEAITLLKTIESESRLADREEQALLAKYVGWGGIPQSFDEHNEGWQREYAELKDLLSEKEHEFARGSTLNAHYTSTEVIYGIYKGLDRLGFSGGNILEPAMGTGNFFGMIPDDLSSKSRLYGVELDPLTGRIAKQLYPDANIEINGFENSNLPDSFFDGAIGNVPFGDYKLNDPKFDKYNLRIHDYFFCKTLDKVRPGGVVAFITSKGTMDKQNTTVRRYLAERAELLGAIRLPNTAFKNTANTEVTSDIIFLKKRDRLIDANDVNWVHTGKNENDIPLNEYFIDNPQMLLGTMAYDERLYGGKSETTLNPDGRDLKEALLEAIEYLPKNAITNIANITELDEAIETTIPADPNVKNFCHVLIDGEIYQRVNSVMEKKDYTRPKAALERVPPFIEIRDLTRRILNMQLNGCTDDELMDCQSELNKKYDAFAKKFGTLNSKYNYGFFGDDADFPLVSALEELDDDGNAKKAAIFSKRTISQVEKPYHADTSSEALSICLNEYGYVDISILTQLTGKQPDDVINDLKGVIFRNPEYANEEDIYVGYEPADEYLSGEVRDKLKLAERVAEENPAFAINVEALKDVQPALLEAHEISVKIGASWVEANYYRQFIIEKFNIPSYERDKLKVQYSNYSGAWHIEKPPSRNTSLEATEVYGTKRMDGYELMQLSLNMKSPKIYDLTLDENGNEKRVLNRKETIAISEKHTQLKQEFKNWIFDEPDRRERLCGIYNQLFNSSRQRAYDGEHLTFPGMSPDIELRKHQKDGIARILYGGNSLLAHEVGAGKTYTMAAAAMEMKRIGLAQKTMLVVPNHLIRQWGNEFQRLYPSANILVATKKDVEKINRQRFCARIATGEWDAVIIGHSSFEKIPMSKERQKNRLERDVESIGAALVEARQEKNNRISIKELEIALKKVEFNLKKLQDSPKDDLVTFEELGVDSLSIDESHFYKNKFIFTKMNNVSGLSKAMAKKSTDLDMKCEYINELNSSYSRNSQARGVTFSTGTPVSNSMVELYTVQTYLQRDELKKLGLQHFDNWAANFGEVVSALELAPSGQNYRVKERFAKFVNLPELMNLYRKVADIQTAEMLNLPVPKVKNGKPITIAVEPSPFLIEYVKELLKRSEDIHSGLVKSHIDNMLCVTSDGRNAALDVRCVDPNAEDFEGSKVNTCIRNVFDIYKRTEEDKSAQMIFCDLSTPKGGKSFSVYDDIKKKLIDMGVKPSEISFIHEADTDLKKEKMFSDVRSGAIRIILGSTAKMGAGTNCQTRLKALHNLDCPYRPSDLSQRAGRIVRQGNKNEEVEIYNYVTKQSFDSYLWQIVESKQKFISQIMSGKSPSRSMDDIDETVLNFAEVKAIATGNPKIKLKMELDTELSRLQVLEAQHRANRYSLEDKIIKKYPVQISLLTEKIGGLEADILLRTKNEPVKSVEPIKTIEPVDGLENAEATEQTPFKMNLGNKDFTERKDAGDLLLKALDSGKYVDREIGTFKGFTIIALPKNNFLESNSVMLKGESTYKVELSSSGVGCISRIENTLKNLETTLADKQRELQTTQNQVETAKVQVTKPFEHEETLKNVLSQLTEINSELDMDKDLVDKPVLVDEDEDILGLDEDDLNENEYDSEEDENEI